MEYFTGIGAVVLLPGEEEIIELLGYTLTKRGLSFRSGKAPGADQAFQKGVERAMAEGDCIRDHQVFLPWQRFESTTTTVSGIYDIWDYSQDEISKSEAIASTIHPVWNNLSRGQRSFHIRNVFQALGLQCDKPSKLLIACADSGADGIPLGGTRTAFKVALDNNIPCLNIRGMALEVIIKWIDNFCPEEIK